MRASSFPAVSALVFDIFGTTFDWWSGVTDQARAIARRDGLDLDPVALADRWRADFHTALDSVRTGRRAFAALDVLHAEGLDRVLLDLGMASTVDPDTRGELVRTWHRLPAWPDAHQGLARLRQHFTVAALSNGGFAQTTNLIKAAGLPFDCVLSAQIARHYKPDPEIYASASELLDLRPHQLMMVAAHGWDLDGARRVGFRTAYVRRPLEKGPNREPEDPDSVTCDVVVDDFGHLADLLIN
jgi:2-haloacid dehalogenase